MQTSNPEQTADDDRGARAPIRPCRAPFALGAGGQAMLETALMLPVFVLLLIGIMEFGVRSYNQGRAAMAARHGAWLGVHGRYNQIETEVKKFFNADAEVKVDKSMEDLDLELSQRAAIDYALFAYTTGYVPLAQENVKVSLTYSRGKMPYAPLPSDGLSSSGAKSQLPSPPRAAIMTLWSKDFMTMCWFFRRVRRLAGCPAQPGIDLIIDGIEQFGEIGKISSVVYEIILRFRPIFPPEKRLSKPARALAGTRARWSWLDGWRRRGIQSGARRPPGAGGEQVLHDGALCAAGRARPVHRMARPAPPPA